MVIIADDGHATGTNGSGQGEATGDGRLGAVRGKVAQAARSLQRGEQNVNDVERLLSAIGGAALIGLALRRRSPASLVTGLFGAMLLQRGATGHCRVYGAAGVSTAGEHHLVQQHGAAAVLDAQKATKVEHSVVIDMPRGDLYRFWRHFENLPRIMSHLESVQVLDERRSHWVAKGPAGQTVEWDAEIINEVPDSIIGWRSVNNATVPNAGSVHFADAASGRGTEIRVVLEYQPPAGRLGQIVAKMFQEEPDQQVRDDLQRFKVAMESGVTQTGELRSQDA